MACVGEGRRRKPVAIALLLSGCGAFGATPAGTSGDGDAGLPDASTSEASPPAEGGVETDGGDPCVAADLVFAVDDGGVTSIGLGGARVSGAFLTRDGYPKTSTEAPTGPQAPAPGQAIDFGPDAVKSTGVRAIDFGSDVAGAVGGTDLTVTGWIKLAKVAAGSGGNRLLSTLHGAAGFELVQDDFKLALGVNEFADLSWTFSGNGLSDDLLPDPATGQRWTFFAVTYHGLAGPKTGQVGFYIGDPDRAAVPRGTRNYPRGPVAPGSSLTIGNFPDLPTERAAAGGSSRVPKALLYDLRVFRRALALAEVQCVQSHAD